MPFTHLRLSSQPTVGRAAAAGAACSCGSITPLWQPRVSRCPHHADNLATVESHLLLPACMGAIASTMPSLLTACDEETGGGGKECHHGVLVPALFVVGLVLLILRAHAVATTTAGGLLAAFRPRPGVFFCMPVDLLT